jgi:hypothetical protein
MAINPQVTEKITFGDLTCTNVYTEAAGSESNIEESIPDSSTDLEITWDCDVSEVVNVLFLSDQAITIETNSGSVPDDTIVLAANVPFFWSKNNGMSLTNFLTTDVTTNIFVTNASGSAATLKIRMTQDPTP